MLQVGCTTLRRLIFVMLGAIPADSVHWEKVSEKDYLRPAIMRHSFLTKTITENMKTYMLKKYFKFVMVRNPLERLVSAYRDKIEPPLKFFDSYRQLNHLKADFYHVKNVPQFQAQRYIIMLKYKPNSLIDWIRANGSYNISVDFPTYVRWIMDSRDADLNEHFSSILHNAAPCRVDYHLYLNFKNYSRDVHLLISRLNTSTDYFVDQSSHPQPGSDTRSTLPHYYSQLSPDSRRRLFVRMAPELDFYYHLYPEEQLSHIPLLGVNKLVSPMEEYWPTLHTYYN